MRIYASADSLRVESTEDGFHLVAETDEGDVIDLRIHHLLPDFSEQVERTIGRWWRDGQAARLGVANRITREDVEAYPLGDPKRYAMQRDYDSQPPDQN